MQKIMKRQTDLKKLLNKILTNSIIFKDPTGVVNKSALKHVQALQKLVQKHPFFHRFVSTNTDFPESFGVAFFIFVVLNKLK